MTSRTKTSFQQKAARVAYTAFFLGLIMAVLGQYVFASGPLVVVGIGLIALSLIPAILAYPWILGF